MVHAHSSGETHFGKLHADSSSAAHQASETTAMLHMGADHDCRMADLQNELDQLKEEESATLRKIEFIDKAWSARRKPFVADLETLRAKIMEKEIEVMHLDHGESHELPKGPAWLSWVFGSCFTCLCSAVIAANLAVMVLEMQGHENALFENLEDAFLCWYVLELGLKAMYLQKGLLIGNFYVVWWNWLDVTIVLSGILDQWAMPLVGHQGFGFGMTNLRCLRLLRLFRIARALKLLKFLLTSDLSWTEDHRFESFMMAVIVVNAVVMWLELDYPCHWWTVVEHLMLAAFTFELCVRLAWHGHHYFSHGDWAWHWLDFVIVTLGVAQQWMIPLYYAASSVLTGRTVTAHGTAEKIAKLLRVIRIARVLRLARLLRSIRPLYKLIQGVMESMQAIGWVMVLTFILLYSAAIVFTTLVGRGYIFHKGDAPDEVQEYYGTVFRTFLSLFKLMNDDQSMVTPIISTVGGQLLFYVFMMISNWIMLAILTSVVSDHMMSASRRGDELEAEATSKKQHELSMRHLTAIFQQIDQDNTGTIDQDEMSSLLSDDDLRAELCSSSGRSMEDLMELLHCVGYNNKGGKRVLLYRQFIHMLQGDSENAKERSIFKLMEHMRAFEFRQETRLNRALKLLGVDDDEASQLPSLAHEMEKIRQLEQSPAASLVKQLTQKNMHPVSQL
eukprot:TRINITY_DN61149_c0_g1_i1.p1 TRINITY_DN61149_c0_g1~~TRINITY_DN61149_c0_g1_i1.p1  ORF type:complete len:673 (-),score=136.97 TRINITY_DN61149_c0_g1_i1:60-2078(-)